MLHLDALYRPTNPARCSLRATTALLGLLLLPCCSSLDGKFQATSKVNFGIFADSTLSLLDELEVPATRVDAVLSREFLEPDGELETQLAECVEASRWVIGGMVSYSLELVTIVESDGSEAEQVETYLGYLRTLARELVVSTGVAAGHFDSTLDEISGSPDLLASLRAAQPILNAAVREAVLLAEQADDHLTALALDVDRKIDAEYADVIRYCDALGGEKVKVLRALEQTHLSATGDSDAFAALRSGGAVRDGDLLTGPEPSQEELEAVAEHLTGRLERLARIRAAIEADCRDYHDAHREFDGLVEAARRNIKAYRITLLLWLHGHQKMASGVTNPAEWFDLNDVPGSLVSLGVSAAL